MPLLTECSADVSPLELPRQTPGPLILRVFPERAALPARLGELASVATAELWLIVLEPRTKDKPLLTS